MAATSVVLNRDQLAQLLYQPSGGVYRDLNRRANRVRNMAKRLAPVDRGILRASIQYEIRKERGELTARIGTNVKYAVYQEFGTRYMKAQPFLRPALKAAK